MLKTISVALIDKTKYNFLTLEVKLSFTQLRQVFTKTLIFCIFDLKYYIWIKINILGYAISSILS